MFGFKNVGKELCFWARFFLILLTIIWFLGTVGAAAAGYFLLLDSGMMDEVPGGIIILLAVGSILIFLIGYMVIRFATIKLYAQGKMVEHLASIDRKMDQLKMAQPVAAPIYAAVPEVAVKETVAVAEAPVEKEPVMNGFCMNCGAQNGDGSMFCTNCGARLH